MNANKRAKKRIKPSCPHYVPIGYYKNRPGIAKKAERVMLLDANIEVIAELMGITTDEVPQEAKTNPAIEHLGNGVYRVYGER